MANIKVAVVNASTVLKDNDISKAIPALQTQVHRDFAPAWGVEADLVFVPKASTPPAGAWWLVILDNSDVAGALGYHDLTSEGLPLGKVFAATDQENGLHENQITVAIDTPAYDPDLMDKLLDEEYEVRQRAGERVLTFSYPPTGVVERREAVHPKARLLYLRQALQWPTSPFI